MTTSTTLGRLRTGALAGAAAGAAGTTALNAATYLDMAGRGRPTSQTPEKTVETLAARAGATVPGEGETRDNRVSGLGALSGILTGVAVGVVAGVVRSAGVRLPLGVAAPLVGAAAMAASDVPMTRLGVADPSEWAPTDWVADALPHLAYGLVTAAVAAALLRDLR